MNSFSRIVWLVSVGAVALVLGACSVVPNTGGARPAAIPLGADMAPESRILAVQSARGETWLTREPVSGGFIPGSSPVEAFIADYDGAGMADDAAALRAAVSTAGKTRDARIANADAAAKDQAAFFNIGGDAGIRRAKEAAASEYSAAVRAANLSFAEAAVKHAATIGNAAAVEVVMDQRLVETTRTMEFPAASGVVLLEQVLPYAHRVKRGAERYLAEVSLHNDISLTVERLLELGEDASIPAEIVAAYPNGGHLGSASLASLRKTFRMGENTQISKRETTTATARR